MPSRLTEITATVVAERHRFGESEPYTLVMDATVSDGTSAGSPPDEGTDTAVAAGDDGSRSIFGAGDSIALKGKSETDGHGLEPAPHFTYRFYGQWRAYKNQRTGQSERQFHWQTFVRATPHSRAGIVKWLAGAPGIGRVLAGRLFDAFQGDAVRLLRTQPEVAAAAVKGLSDEAALKAAAWLDEQKALEDCSIELVDLLEGHGLPRGVVKAAVKEYGNLAAQLIKANPYLLMRFRGCGFKRADALYLELGHDPARLKRQALCAWHALASRSDGDTWHWRPAVDAALGGAIAGADVRVEAALELATRSGMLAIQRTDGAHGPLDWDGDAIWVAEGKKARAETRLARLVVEAASDDARWPAFDDDPMTLHQSETLVQLLAGHPFAILGGGPGTGKTFCAAQIVAACGKAFGFDQIAACAPTGKAAVRLTEAMAGYGLPLRARTIHSLLGVASSGDGWSFTHDATNPLPYKVLVVDESSMIDVDLAASLLAARPRGCLVLVIGDVGQLPPVGHGAPLRDFIAAGLPSGELTEIRRNSGEIVEACAAIRQGTPFAAGGNLACVAAPSAEAQRDALLEAIRTESLRLDVDPIWGVQVLVAVNKKSELSRRDLNQLLQAHLNPRPAVHGSPFRLGDKLVNTKNGWFPLVEVASRANGRVRLADNDEQLETSADGKVYVANGELGEVVEVAANYLHVRLTAPKRLVVVPRGAADVNEGDDEDGATGTGCHWELGYALSVHKSQGSEWPVAIVVLDDSSAAKRVCSREWLYTAISRAKRQCVLVGTLGVAHGFARRTAIDKRKTFLRERIAEQLSPF